MKFLERITFLGAEFTDALTQDIASLTLKNSLGPAKNYHVRPLGLAIICEERINDYVFKSNSCIKFAEFSFSFVSTEIM